MKDPAFLFYSSDFIAGTMFMTDEQVGKYIRLLCAQHQLGPLSEEDMLFICKTPDAKILSKFKKDENGLYYNERLEKESDKRRKYSESRSNNRKNAKSKASKSEDKKDTVDSYEPSCDGHMGNENRNINKDKNDIEIKEIVSFLNAAVDSNYRASSKSTKSHINARLKEGFTVDDFKAVIVKKCNEWKSDAKMSAYLRPETLFGAKFEGYLNQMERKNDGANAGNNTKIRAGGTQSGVAGTNDPKYGTLY